MKSGKPGVITTAKRMLAAGAGLALAGCAAQAVGDAGAPAAAPLAPTVAQAATVPAYQLTAEEWKLDCPKLTGRMRVRITTLRSDLQASQGSATSRTLQSMVTPVFGGTRRGADPAADQRADRARLDAFNARLGEKKCKMLDIDAELRGETPAPAAKAAPKKG